MFPIHGLFFCLAILLYAFSPDNPKLYLANSYPKWLKDKNNNYSDQTSGICFIGSDKGIRYFLLADDIGHLHMLGIDDNEVFTLKRIELSEKVSNTLKDFAKWDFEEISYDKYDKKVYLSIEGNGENYLNEVGIYELIFKNNDIFSCLIEDIKKIDIKPKNVLLEYVMQNIGFEGIAVDKDYMYLGLEGFEVGKLFADSTFIYILDKKTYELKKKISTKKYKIGTICGLTTLNDRELLGVDRNKQKIFKIILDKKMNIIYFNEYDITIQIPGHNHLQYVAAIESIALDDKSNIYCADDPWRYFYIPPSIIFDKLDKQTQENFNNYIPIIYKFNLK